MTIDFDEVRVEGVSRHFGRRRALSQVSLTLRSGDIIGLLGPNGAGKSTLIGILATLVTPNTGAVHYGTFSADASGSALRQHIGVLAHELYLYGELSARQNLRFFAELYGLNPDGRVDAALERAGLSERANDIVATFSRGMRQRLALERALLHAPKLALFDEPFTGLDDSAAGTVSARLKQLAASGCIVVVATHDLDIADGLVTRLAVIQNGKLVGDERANGSVRARYRELARPS